MTTHYSINRALNICLPLVSSERWSELLIILEDFSQNLKFRGRMDTYLGNKKGKSYSAIKTLTNEDCGENITPLSVWISSLPWEVRLGLENHTERSLDSNHVSFSNNYVQSRIFGSGTKIRGMLFHHSELEFKPYGYDFSEITYHIGQVKFDLDIYFFTKKGSVCGFQRLLREKPEKTVRCPVNGMFALEIKSEILSPDAVHTLLLPRSSGIDNKLDFCGSYTNFSGEEFSDVSIALAYRKMFNQKVIIPFIEFLLKPSTKAIPCRHLNEVHAIKIDKSSFTRHERNKNFMLHRKSFETIGLSHIFERLAAS